MNRRQIIALMFATAAAPAFKATAKTQTAAITSGAVRTPLATIDTGWELQTIVDANENSFYAFVRSATIRGHVIQAVIDEQLIHLSSGTQAGVQKLLDDEWNAHLDSIP